MCFDGLLQKGLHFPERYVTFWLPIMDLENNPHFDLVFSALGSRMRRSMMDVIKMHPGCSVNDLCEHFEISRIGVMKHLEILVNAKLVISRKSGRTRQLFFNAAPIQLIYDRWTDEYSAFWVTQAVDLKYKAEGRAQVQSAKEGARAAKEKRKTPSRAKRKNSSSKSKTKVA